MSGWVIKTDNLFNFTSFYAGPTENDWVPEIEKAEAFSKRKKAQKQMEELRRSFPACNMRLEEITPVEA